MFLARVIGSVVATIKAPGLEGARLLVVVPVDARDPERRAAGGPIVACDQAQAGPGDEVYCVTSREATHAMPDPFVPVDAAIVGVVDRVDYDSGRGRGWLRAEDR